MHNTLDDTDDLLAEMLELIDATNQEKLEDQPGEILPPEFGFDLFGLAVLEDYSHENSRRLVRLLDKLSFTVEVIAHELIDLQHHVAEFSPIFRIEAPEAWRSVGIYVTRRHGLINVLQEYFGNDEWQSQGVIASTRRQISHVRKMNAAANAKVMDFHRANFYMSGELKKDTK